MLSCWQRYFQVLKNAKITLPKNIYYIITSLVGVRISILKWMFTDMTNLAVSRNISQPYRAELAKSNLYGLLNLLVDKEVNISCQTHQKKKK